jgi:hypothetical protein
MPTFGFLDTSAGNEIGPLTNLARCNIGASMRYGPAVSGDVITSLHFYGWSLSQTETVKIAVYEFDTGTGLPTARVGTGTVTLLKGASPPQWESVSVNIPLTAGKHYCLAFGENNGTDSYLGWGPGTGNERSGSDRDGVDGVLTNPWVHSTYSSGKFNIYATYTAGSPGGTLYQDLTLVSETGAPLANLTGLKCYGWDTNVPADLATTLPVDYTAAGTTDANGLLRFERTNTTLIEGNVTLVLVTTATGSTSQSPAGRAFFGPAPLVT